MIFSSLWLPNLLSNSDLHFLLAFRHEFKSNHREWVESVEPKVGPGVSSRVLEALTTTHDNVKTLYKVRTEMRAAIRSLLKVFDYL